MRSSLLCAIAFTRLPVTGPAGVRWPALTRAEQDDEPTATSAATLLRRRPKSIRAQANQSEANHSRSSAIGSKQWWRWWWWWWFPPPLELEFLWESLWE